MKILKTTKLRIKDQHELLNQIAGTYKDFYRAAMEYVDNSVDAAECLKQKGIKKRAVLNIEIDSKNKKVTFTDNCGGMSPDELCDLLASVGRSTKKLAPWANGQFGFGVHAFRAFAREAEFTSTKGNKIEAQIKINREYDENKDVECYAAKKKVLSQNGTMVEISKFDPHVFHKSQILGRLVSEIEHHFDDVLRDGLIDIMVSLDKSKYYKCKSFDYSGLPGEAIKYMKKVVGDDGDADISVDLKILNKSQDNRSPVITNKRRRIQTIFDLKSFKTYLKYNGFSNSVWDHPFVVGSIEIDGVCSPNITRDDLRSTPGRDTLYKIMLDVQLELDDKVDEIMHKKAHESYKKLGNMMSDCLSNILKNFRLKYERMLPSAVPGKALEELSDMVEGDVGFGGPGPGGVEAGSLQEKEVSAGESSIAGSPPVGEEGAFGGIGDESKGRVEGASQERLTTASGPKIEFGNHPGENRVIDLGHSLIINTQHKDFVQRNKGRDKSIKLDPRLLNYVSMVVAPYCVHRLFEKRGKVPNPLEVGENVVELATKLESVLINIAVGQDLKIR